MVAQIDCDFFGISKKKTFTRFISYLFYEGRPLTTKGQWINPFVFFLYRVQSLLPFEKKVESPVFIVGTGRSGTTILGVTLGMHKDVGFLNEPKAAWAYAYPHEDVIGSYNQNAAFYSLNEHDVTPEVKRRIKKIYGHYLRVANSSKLVDKYPELIFRVPFVRQIFPDAKFIFLFRDGYDTCSSICNWSRRLGITYRDEVHDWWGKNNRKWNLLCDQVVAEDAELSPFLDKIKEYRDHTAMAAVEWIVTMKKGLELIDKYSDFVFPLKYEDYVSSESVRNKVIEFCGLAPDDNYKIYCEKVLSPSEPKPVVTLPPEIEFEFLRVMDKLGYER